MATLLIGNQYTDRMVGELASFPAEVRRVGGNTAYRLLWGAHDGDVLIAAREPSPEFLRYALGLVGVDPASVTVVVPRPGRFGTDVLSADRLLNADFQAQLRDRIDTAAISRVLPFYFDNAAADLVEALGLGDSTPGFAFVGQNGPELLNSKSVFRAVAAGVGAPIADGRVVSDRREAAARVWALLDAGRCVIVKQDFHVGGFGNEILSPVKGVQAIGASQVVTLTDRVAVAEHVARQWSRYSNEERHNVIVEDYAPDSVPLYAEAEITDTATSILNHGEMRMAPVFDGFVIPGKVTTPAQREAFLAAVTLLCEPVRAIGYRGLINIDGIVTPDGATLLTEFNGRLGGSTHLHEVGTRLVGPDYAERRFLATRNHWPVPSFDEALSRLRANGIAFDSASRTGVVITCDHSRLEGAVEYCVIATDVEQADEIEKLLWESSPH
jgi:hypothetical protein